VTVPEGIAWKLRRARTHFEGLHAEVDTFLNAEPPPYRIVAEDDPYSRDRIYRMEIGRPLPAIEWGVVVGDVIHNLRSGLDHLAYALCLANAPTEEPPNGTEFPIFAAEDGFDRRDRGGGLYKIRGMASEAQEAIRALQPYLHGNAAESQSLWLLQKMSNIDKHRYLHLTVIGYPMISFFVDPDVEITPAWSDDHSIVARAHPLTPAAEINSEPVITPQVVFDELPRGDWRPLDMQLRTFVRLVREIAEDLSGRFLPEPVET
jgi:hypothetical protein